MDGAFVASASGVVAPGARVIFGRTKVQASFEVSGVKSSFPPVHPPQVSGVAQTFDVERFSNAHDPSALAHPPTPQSVCPEGQDQLHDPQFNDFGAPGSGGIGAHVPPQKNQVCPGGWSLVQLKPLLTAGQVVLRT